MHLKNDAPFAVIARVFAGERNGVGVEVFPGKKARLVGPLDGKGKRLELPRGSVACHASPATASHAEVGLGIHARIPLGEAIADGARHPLTLELRAHLSALPEDEPLTETEA